MKNGLKIGPKHVVAAIGLVVAGAVGAFAAAPAAKLPDVSMSVPSPGGYFKGTGATTLNQTCVTCHSAGFVDRQPHLPAATWKVEVTKMKKVFGAPYDTSKIPEIVDALVARQKAMK